MTVKFIEKSIIKKVDELIKIIIDLSRPEDNYFPLRNKAVQKTLELLPLLLHFLEGNLGHVEPLINQLIMEKLPDPRIISSFGNFQEELNTIISEAMEIFQRDAQFQLKKIQPIENNNNVIVDVLTGKLQETVIKAFPSQNILLNYQIRGQILEVYIPELRIALISETLKNNFNKLDYLCKKSGIKLLLIPKEIEENYRRLIRFIKRRNM